MLESNTIDYIAIGERVRQHRRVAKLTQEQLAERVDVSSSFIGHIERGEKKPSVETMAKLSQVLDAPLDELVLGVKHACKQQDCPLFGDFVAFLEGYGINPGER